MIRELGIWDPGADLQTCRLADLQTCGLVDLWTCGLVDLWTCRLADLQTCGLADLQTCGLVDLWTLLIRSHIPPLNIIHKTLANHFVSARSGVIACEVPVAKVIRAGHVQVFDGLVDDLYIRLDIRRG